MPRMHAAARQCSWPSRLSHATKHFRDGDEGLGFWARSGANELEDQVLT